MLDSVSSMLSAIRLGEDSSLELKRINLSGTRITGPSRETIADEIAAFANGRGGVILLGVDDSTRDVLGLPLAHLDAVEAWVREACNDLIKPAVDADIRKMELPDASGVLVPIIRIDIARSLFVHRGPGGYFRRIGSSKREMPPEVLARLFQERSQSRVIRFDESAVPGTGPGDIDDHLAGRFLRDTGEPHDEALRKLRLIADDLDGVPRLSVAGVLMATREPEVWLPHATIQAVSYSGERSDVNYQEDARDIAGPLDKQVFDAVEFVRRNTRVSAQKTFARTENPEFGRRAVFEAVVNAVAHRDYSMSGGRIRLHLFRDRLELYSPGGLPNTLTTDSMALRQYSRNELIVSLLARCRVPKGTAVGRSYLMDRRGDGVPVILKEGKRLSGRVPEYTVLDESEVLLQIWSRRHRNSSATAGAKGG